MIHQEAWYKEAVRPIDIPADLARKVTNILWDALMSYIENADPSEVIPSGKWQWEYKTDPSIYLLDVKGKQKRLTLRLNTDDFRYPIAVRGYFVNELSGNTQSGYLTVILSIGGKKVEEVANLLNTEVRGNVLSTVYHELTHTRDIINFVGYDSALLNSAPNQDEQSPIWYAHFNDPVEIRAYMQEIVREVDLPEEGDSDFNPDWNFSDWLMAGINKSHTWSYVSPYLTPESKKKILQGIVQHLQDKGFSWW